MRDGASCPIDEDDTGGQGGIIVIGRSERRALSDASIELTYTITERTSAFVWRSWQGPLTATSRHEEDQVDVSSAAGDGLLGCERDCGLPGARTYTQHRGDRADAVVAVQRRRNWEVMCEHKPRHEPGAQAVRALRTSVRQLRRTAWSYTHEFGQDVARPAQPVARQSTLRRSTWPTATHML
jgi:hypothetical protein